MDFFDKSTYRNGRFASRPEGKGKKLIDVLRWVWTRQARPWPRWREASALPRDCEQQPSSSSATWINHSTVLLKLGGTTILTDPIFSNHVGPLPWLGIKRKIPPSHTLQSLPPIDIILISHNHYDHLDAFSIKTLVSLYNPLIIVPLKNAPLLKSLGSSRVIELDWWENYQFNPGLNVTLTPALHWSRRSLRDTCRSLWGSFVIENTSEPVAKLFDAENRPFGGCCGCFSSPTLLGRPPSKRPGQVLGQVLPGLATASKIIDFPLPWSFATGSSHKVFFAGDTGYHSHFQKIYQKFGPMDLSFLPIGAYEPRWFMKEAHMNPADAVQAHLDLHSKLSVGIHFGTFRLTDEGIDDPIHDLKAALEQTQIDPSSFIAPSLGQTVSI